MITSPRHAGATVPTVRDFLERLRPSGTPGAASLSGVPADRVGERSAELEPVLARLSDVLAEAARIRQEASVAAAARVATAAERARALVSSARRSAEAERRAAAAHARAQAEAETRERLADAEREAASVADIASAREAEFVARVVAEARAEAAHLLAESP
jgi:hypothetical protein